MTTRAVPAVGSIEADRSQPVHTRTVDKPRSAVRVGVIGYGYWGPNIVRNLSGLETCELAAVCDKNPAALKRVTRAYPGVQATTEFSEVLRSPDIDAVAIVTPVWTHFELAKAALEHGKHVFVEKPFTSTSQQAEQLIELAERKNLRIMVDHTFLFCGAVRKIRDLVDTAAPASSRTGWVWSPKVDWAEALKVELGFFLNCGMKAQTPINGGGGGLRGVRLLEAAEESLRAQGRLVGL